MERATLAAKRPFRPSRSKGQCFLKDSRTIERIVAAIEPDPGETLVEIGSGAGELTLPLSRTGARVIAIESDPRLFAELRAALPEDERIELLQADATELDFDALLRDRGLERVRVCGNLPYSVAAPILLRLLSAPSRFEDLTLMFQEEVAERLVARPGTKAYGFLSVVAQQAASIRVHFRIPPEAFRPRPRVVSALVHFALRHEDAPDVGDPKTFRALVKGLLAHRRKTIANNIKHLRTAGLDGATIARGIEELEIRPQRRAETMSVDEFAELSRICASLS